MIVKLGNILRRLLRKGDSFVPLREEFEFLDDYLDIEVARFGRDKLRVVKELEPDSLDHLVPSMILQPLVENAVKHGFSPKVEGGSIYLRSRCAEQRLVIEVEDDGVGHGGSTAPASRHRHRHGQCHGTPAGGLRRRGRDRHREPARQRNLVRLCCRCCRRKRWVARWSAPSTRSASSTSR